MSVAPAPKVVDTGGGFLLEEEDVGDRAENRATVVHQPGMPRCQVTVKLLLHVSAVFEWKRFIQRSVRIRVESRSTTASQHQISVTWWPIVAHICLLQVCFGIRYCMGITLTEVSSGFNLRDCRFVNAAETQACGCTT